MTNVSFSKKTIIIDGVTKALQHEIIFAFELSGKVIVLFDPDAHIPKFGQFNNLIALNLNGVKLWEAELPSTESGDCYYKITSKNPLQAISFKSYVCDIDVNTGKIIDANFTK